MWGCEDVDQEMRSCEDVDQQMWRCEDLDQQMWVCEDVLQRLLFYEEPFAGAFGKKTVRSQSLPPASPNMSCRKLSYSSELVIACGLPWWWLESNHWNRMDTWRFCLSSCSMTYYLSVWTMNGNSRSNLQIYSSLCRRLWSTHGLVWKYDAQNLMVYHCLSSCVLYFKFPDKS